MALTAVGDVRGAVEDVGDGWFVSATISFSVNAIEEIKREIAF